jgi:hypothetical protein
MWKKNKYLVIKKSISKELCEFAYKHLLLKKNVADCLFKNREIPYHSIEWGHYTDEQVPGSFSIYSDVVMEQLLINLKPTIEKNIGVKLVENYSFARLYKKYDILKKHIDRYSCEYSVTLNLGGDKWPINLIANKKEVKIDLEPGDLLVYEGCRLPHWRDVFLGNMCAQVFLHYSNIKDKNKTKWDNRPCLGYPFPRTVDRNPKK